MGLCVPTVCTADSLKVFDKLYQQGLAYTGLIKNPETPYYTFPQAIQEELSQKTFTFYAMLFVFISFLGLSIFGYLIERGTIGDTHRQSKLVEAVEDGRPDKVSIEAKKKRWALVVYSFSVSRNFKEIFLRPNRSIKDKKFEVFNGLRFIMACWIMLGHCYLLGS